MWTIAEWYRDGRERGERDGDLIRNRAGLRVELMRERGPENIDETVREMTRFHDERFDAVPPPSSSAACRTIAWMPDTGRSRTSGRR